jgi:hypothetical protein
MSLFSKRHRRALVIEKTLKVSVPGCLRRRVWLVLQEFDFSYHKRPNPYDTWTENTSVLTEVEAELRKAYGTHELEAFDSANRRGTVNLQGFIEGCYPSQVLDALESAYSLLELEHGVRLQREINSAFREEGCPWLMTDGAFFRVDSEFLASQVLDRSQELMRAEGFLGALDEFTEARNDLVAGDGKGAIHNACKSFESTLKTVLGVDEGNASKLLERIEGSGVLDEVPLTARKAISTSVLMALPTLRNKLGGHGQGSDRIDVPSHYAALAVHLAGAFSLFVISSHLERSQRVATRSEFSLDFPEDEDLPF